MYGLFVIPRVRKFIQDFISPKLRGAMTYKEFKRQVFAIYNDTYKGEDVSPIEYGIRRAEFEEEKLKRLIALADQTIFSTAKRKVAGWRRQLDRVHVIRVRLEQRRSEAMPMINAYDRFERAIPFSITKGRASQLRAQ
jgi:hypothetical protein